MFYSIKISASDLQAELIQLFKNGDDQVIQTADGLCVKSSKSDGDMQELLNGKNLSFVSVNSKTADISPDVVKFIHSN